MGEAKRWGPGEADGLPHFIFGRERAVEEAGGFSLAGKLVTDIPKHRELDEGDHRLISKIIGELKRLVQREPNLEEASIWRGGVKPPGGLVPPFSAAALRERTERCTVVGVRVDPRNDGDFVRVDDVTMAEIMGRN
jgi:hypothetical protein